jgi:hypothetical protein
VQYNAPDMGLSVTPDPVTGYTSMGQIKSAQSMRNIQLALKLYY